MPKTSDKIKKTPKKKNISKSSKTKQNINELKIKVKSSEDKHIRLLAEFDNFKKRKVNEIEKLIKYEGFDFFKSILPILDDIDRTLNLKDVKKNKSIFDGFSMIKSKITNLLESKEIATYDSMNENFNPEFHEAIMMKKSKKDSNLVIEEYEKGYMYKDKVLRHAKVVVSE
ncbi:MAG: nucleotide exchange factor GrpE [Candidatus Marinimicrobia bacterium]|nr:nucleotide exchange factor GrpE [Candidatus Neomarinimicrobiota bacterium]|tara:strand:- start:27236 stop:27748 length:513 start_codon:yes stop_codon:yes gene_type:complete